jgi:Fe-S cluster assembly ATP-binding protein
MANILEITDLFVEVDGQTLLHDINMVIPEGEVHALLGPNGSGKTSLMMTIMGFTAYRISQGRIVFEGIDITDTDITERARMGIGISQQRPPTITGVKLRHIIDYITSRDSMSHDEVMELVREARMEPFLDRDVNAGLSGGEIKRAELLQLLASQPQFSMMDEPESGVDLESLALVGALANRLFSRDILHPVRRRSGLVITHTGHILDYIHADKAHIMLDGHVSCSGNPQIVLDTVRDQGYEGCVSCMAKGDWQ